MRAKGPDIKLGTDFAFVEYIEDQIINKKRSPGAALAQIKIDGEKFDTEICETTLYNWIYRGDTIEQRPEEINNRDTFGNWEWTVLWGAGAARRPWWS